MSGKMSADIKDRSALNLPPPPGSTRAPMGNSQSQHSLSHHHHVTIKTGSYCGQHAGHANICLRLHDKDGTKSETVRSAGRYFKPASERMLEVETLLVSEVDRVELWLERSGQNTDLTFFTETVTVKKIGGKDETDGEDAIFPFHRHITMTSKVVKKFDSLLPQDDERPIRRKEGVLWAKLVYRFQHRAANSIPVQRDITDTAQHFSKAYFQNEFLKTGVLNTIKQYLIPIFSSRWTSLQDIDNIYNRCILHFRQPKPVERYLRAFKNRDWRALDEMFAEQRLIGTNPLVIRRVKQYDDIKDKDGFLKIRVNEDTRLLYMDDDCSTVKDAISQGRLYMVDYTDILKKMQPPNGILAAPIALFFVTNDGTDGKLMPVAIQMFKPYHMHDNDEEKHGRLPRKDCDNPLFTPYIPDSNADESDGDTSQGYTWFMAKLWFNNADASYHQSCSHLGFTHLLMETMYLALRQTVSLSHPLHRLMAPHFLYTLEINKEAFDLLINPGGWVDSSMTIGVEGMFEIIRRRYEGNGCEPWRLDREGDLEADLEDRDVGDLPGYWFRDDAKELHKIIKEYVTEVVEKCYKQDPRELEDDHEIQAWAELLKKDVNKSYTPDGGCGIKGIPSKDGIGHFSDFKDLINVITSIIYTCSVGHAAVNFNQYDEYGFPLAYPALLHGGPPRDKEPLSEKDILQDLPTKQETLAAMNITNILSQRGARPLGDFEVQYQYDDAGKQAVNSFKEKLRAVQLESPTDYDILDPALIPNSISI